MAALRTMVVLLDHLQIRPLDDTGPGDENAHVVARLFSKYSSALLQSLEICHMDFPVCTFTPRTTADTDGLRVDDG